MTFVSCHGFITWHHESSSAWVRDTHRGGGKPSPTITHSDVEFNGTSGTNIDADPNFENPPSDYSLQCLSPRHNKGNTANTPADSEDADEDRSDDDKVDLDLAYRIVGDDVDMGCYEKQPIGSCLSADISPMPCQDGDVDVDDLLAVNSAWGPCEPQTMCPADITATTGVVDTDGLLAVINQWGTCMQAGQMP
jgi:hypothetical protein